MKHIHPSTSKRTWILFLIVVVLLGFSVQQMVTAQSRTASPGSKGDEILIRSLEEDLKNPNIDEEGRKDLEIKLDVLYQNATQEAKVNEHLTEVSKLPTKIRTSTFGVPGSVSNALKTAEARKRPTGITNQPDIAFHGVEVENEWGEMINGNYVFVVAGVDLESNKGVLIVSSDTNQHFEYFYTPTNSGSVRITDVKGFQLVLKTKGNEVVYFDALGRKFISSLGEVVPTITPVPTATTTPTETPIPAYP